MINIIHRYFRGRWERYYFKSHWHFVLDFTLAMVIILLAASLIGLYLYRPNLPSLGSYYPQTVDLNNPPLNLEFSAPQPTFATDSSADLQIDFQNKATAALNDVTIDLLPAADNFFIAKIEATGSAAVAIQGQQVILTNIPAGGSGEADIKIYFRVKDTALRRLDWQARSSYTFAGQPLTQTYTLPSLTLSATLAVRSYAYYTSPQGDQLGSGPLPPVVGLPTNYWVFWEAQSASEFKNLVLSARLPHGVELTSHRSLLAGEFSYNAAARQLIWKISDLQGQSDSYRLSFEVQLIPIADQAGQILPLINDFRYYGEDALTGEASAGSQATLTTDLASDHFNSGQGQVLAR